MADRARAVMMLQGVGIAVDGKRLLSSARGWGMSLRPTDLDVVVTEPLQLETLDSLPSPERIENPLLNKVVVTQRSGKLSFADVARRVAGCGAVALMIINSRPPSAAATGKMTGIDFRPCRGLYDGKMPVIGVGQEDESLLLGAKTVHITVSMAVDPPSLSHIVMNNTDDAEICRLAMRCMHHETVALVPHGDMQMGQQLADAIIIAMVRNPSDRIIAEYGVFNLGTLVFNDLIDSDGVFECIGAITKAMETHREIERVAAWGCRALTHISMGGTDIKPFGGQLRVKDALDYFPESIDVRQWGAKALDLDGMVSASRRGKRPPGTTAST
jgi:hypothetical protein